MGNDPNDYATLLFGVALAHIKLLGGRIDARRRQERSAEVDAEIRKRGWSGNLADAARRSALAHSDQSGSYSLSELIDELKRYVAEQEAAGADPNEVFATMLAAGRERLSE